MSWDTKTVLQLGRVSNVPTVWTNTVAGVVLASGTINFDWRLLILLLAMTLAYIGGMFLNDAFDKDIDAKERPERPIPSGKVTALSVFYAGFGMLASSVLLIAWCALASGGGWSAIAAALALAAAIVLYNAWHKDNPLSPFVMGLCRMLVYITAGWTYTSEPSAGLYVGALVLLCYLIGLTYTAKQENIGEVKNMWPLAFLSIPMFYAITTVTTGVLSLVALFLFIAWIIYALRFVLRRQPGDIPKAVVSMIAGISLVDAMLIATAGPTWLVGFAFLGFGLTLFLQRYIAGT